MWTSGSKTRTLVLLAVGILVAAFVVSLVQLLRVSQQRSNDRAAGAAPVPAQFLAPPTATVAGGPSAGTSAPTRVPPSAPSKPLAPKVSPIQPIIPDQIYIPSLGVNKPVIALRTVYATDAFLNGMQVPSFGVPPDKTVRHADGTLENGMQEAAWWSDGPKLGAPGLAVVLGHNQIGGDAIFNNIGLLRAGDVIGFTAKRSGMVEFRVIGQPITGLLKTDSSALQNALENPPPNARLALITCSGHFNGSESDQNTVVFASIVIPSGV